MTLVAFSEVLPIVWFSALSGERRVLGKRMVEFVYASRNTLILTAWGNHYRLRFPEWHPVSSAHVNQIVNALPRVPDALIGATQ